VIALAPRWRKVVGDIGETPVRCALAVLAMTAGAFGVGMILTAYTILTRELKTTYAATNPAAAVFSVSRLDEATLDQVRSLAGVAEVETRPALRARIRLPDGDTRSMTLFVLGANVIDRIEFAEDGHPSGPSGAGFVEDRRPRLSHVRGTRTGEGACPPHCSAFALQADEVLIERASLSVTGAKVGDRVSVKTGDGVERSLRIAGTVHAAGLAPGWMDHHVSAFVSERSFPAPETSRLLVSVAGDRLDLRHIRAVASGVRTFLEQRGVQVTAVEIPPPGRHPHADQMATFLFLLGVFGALTLALSAVLVATMIHALLTEQVRQVGMMKAIGATTRQIAALYLVQVSLLAATAAAIGMPLGFFAGRGYAAFASTILNANITSNAVPLWAVAAQLAAALLVPLLVAAGPVLRASRISVHEAFRDGAGRQPSGQSAVDRLLSRLAWFPRPLMLSLRTAFQRRGRLALTVTTLAVGGAVFLTTLNAAAAWRRALDEEGRSRRYDLDVRLAVAQPVSQLQAALAKIPEVALAESWNERAATIESGADAASLRLHGLDTERITVVAPPIPSALLSLPLLQGRWLRPEDRDTAVINQALLARLLVGDPNFGPGGTLRLRIDGVDHVWRVVGVAKELVPSPVAYTTAGAQAPPVTTRTIHVATRRHDPASLLAASRAIERALPGVSGIQSLADLRKAVADHLVIINVALMLAAALVVLVGALGLTSAMMLSVVERTRELGVLSAMGATPRVIARHVVVQGMLIAALSWCAAVALAFPLTFFVNTMSGLLFIKSALAFVMSPGAAATWLALVLILGALASFYPAWRASRLTIREALSYE
jgi:putative ABC transport system permease protein